MITICKNKFILWANCVPITERSNVKHFTFFYLTGPHLNPYTFIRSLENIQQQKKSMNMLIVTQEINKKEKISSDFHLIEMQSNWKSTFRSEYNYL